MVYTKVFTLTIDISFKLSINILCTGIYQVTVMEANTENLLKRHHKIDHCGLQNWQLMRVFQDHNLN